VEPRPGDVMMLSVFERGERRLMRREGAMAGTGTPANILELHLEVSLTQRAYEIPCFPFWSLECSQNIVIAYILYSKFQCFDTE
jgi:hypothetical protein